MATHTRPLPPSDRPTLADASGVDAPLDANEEIDGRYRIETLLGTGAMGAVYRARHLRVGRPVAIKVLAPQWASHATMAERFREEARAASAIGHPGIVNVIDAGSLPDGRPYLVMELLEGRPLTAVIGKEAPLHPPRAIAILAEIARAIAAAHDAGIVHRDLKPENVMLATTPDGERVKVLDFGIAHAVAPLRARLTIPGSVMGTPEYMAPEQVRGDDASPSFDIYALGVIAYEALSGCVPIGGATSMEILAKKSLEPCPSLATARPDLPGDLVAVIDGCLQREPADRPSSARRLAEALERVGARLAGAAVSRSGEPKASRRRGWVAASLIVALAGGVGVVAIDREAPTRDAVTELDDSGDVPPPSPALQAERVPPLDPGEPPPPGADVRSSPGADVPGAEIAPSRRDAARETRPDANSEVPAGASAAPRCPEARHGAEAARKDQNWTRLLRLLDARACFPAAERTRLRTKAYMELRKWDRCAAAGAKSGDPEVKRMVELCESRRG